MSPGLAYSCFELLELIERRALTAQEVISAFRNIGVMPAEAVFSKCQRLRWIEVTEHGTIVLQAAGQCLVALTTHEQRLRQALLDYVDIESPIWLQNSLYGRRKVTEFAELAIVQLFDEAGLLQSTADDVIRFWDSLAARARGQKNDFLLSIGRDGERLSIDYERRRTGLEPQWIAVENNHDGYDLLSVVSAEDKKPLLIEVKSSRIGSHGLVYLTRREWEIATTAEAHVFHLWDLSSDPQLAVIGHADLVANVPLDRARGKWQIAVLPFMLKRPL